MNIPGAGRLSVVVDCEVAGFGKDRVAVAESAIDTADVVGRSDADDEAFTAFFTAEFGALAAYCSRLLSRGAAEDAAQEALVRVWTRWRTVRDPPRTRTWWRPTSPAGSGKPTRTSER